MNNRKIAQIGGGPWSITLANILAKNGKDVTLWVYDKTHTYPEFKPDKKIYITEDINEAIAEKDFLVFAVNTKFLPDTIKKIKKENIKDKAIAICASKGFLKIKNKIKVTSQYLENKLDIDEKRFAAISGGNIAVEVNKEVITETTLASRKKKLAKGLIGLFYNKDFFVLEPSKDIVGIQVCGALKNAYAIIIGIGDYLVKSKENKNKRFGKNTESALLRYRLKEMEYILDKTRHYFGEYRRISSKRTILGPAGIGDLDVTSKVGRNSQVGRMIGEGKSIEQIIKYFDRIKQRPEGPDTISTLYKIMKNCGIKAPFIEEAYHVIYDKKDCLTAVDDILKRSKEDYYKK